LSPRGQKVFKR